MPIAALAPAIIGGGMSFAQGLLGKGSNKSTSNATQNIDKTTTSQSSQDQAFQQGTQYDEDPLMQIGRLGLMSQFNNAFNKANQPMYGDAEKASLIHNTNELTSAALNKLKQSMAGSGGLFSGAFNSGASDIFRGGNANIIQGLMQMPAMNKKAYQEAVNPLLGMAAGWLGRAPVNSTTSGFGSANTNSTTNEKGTITNSGVSTAQGPSGLSAGFGNLLGFGGGVLGDVITGNGGRWGIGGRKTGGGAGMWGFGDTPDKP